MQTTEELTAMLPAELTGIMGCTEYNKIRDDALRAVLARKTMTERAIGRLNPDDLRAVYDAEMPFGDALLVFKKTARALHAEYQRLMHEPAPGSKTMMPIVWDVRPLLSVKGKGAAEFHAKVMDFAHRCVKALGAVQDIMNAAAIAYDRARAAGNATDLQRQARNKTFRGMEKAAAPFAAEWKKLEAERVRRFGK